MSTIDSTVTTTVTLGTETYGSSLTITSTGEILLPAYSGAAGIDSIVAGAYLNDSGNVYGGSGDVGTGTAGGAGGVGIDLGGAATVIVNGEFPGGIFSFGIHGGKVYGGNGIGYSTTNPSLSSGGAGGIGIDLGGSGATLTSDGVIRGGSGAGSKDQASGAGGDAVAFGGSALTNYGDAYGGRGGAVYGTFGSGGAGGMGLDVISAATVANHYTIGGGYGGGSVSGASLGAIQGGAGGVGVYVGAPGASFNNTSIIRGGRGGYGESSGGGNGGAGVVFSGSSMTNTGYVRGGVGGAVYNFSYAGGVGGDGVDLKGAAVLTNEVGGKIAGGVGGGFFFTDRTDFLSNVLAGDGVRVAPTTTLINDGTINGGDGAGSSDLGGAGIYQTGGTFTNDATGVVSGGGGGGTGLLLTGGSASNDGQILGAGAASDSGPGVAVEWQGGSLSNTGTISGGAGEVGLRVAYNSTYQILTNGGTINGGSGDAAVNSGVGGTGVYINESARLNVYSGTINGGAGTSNGDTGYSGGTGAFVAGGSTLLDGTQQSNSQPSQASIDGGAGGYGATTGGAGGIGVNVEGGIFYNPGTVTGGTGGGSNPSTGTGGVGGVGVYLNSGDLQDEGTISGGADGAGGMAGGLGDAVYVGPLGGTIQVLPGATFNGQVVANPGGNAYLDLIADNLTGVGTQFTGFGMLGISYGSTAGVTVTPGAFADNELTVLGLGSSSTNTFDATNVMYSTVVSQVASGQSPFSIPGNGDETFTENGVTVTFENLGGGTLVYSEDPNGGTDITLACYRRGTRIATPHGDLPIEALAIGDPVLTIDGMPRPIRWIGRRSYSRSAVAGNPDAVPIRISAGALGDGLPRRDLWVSPGHALYLGGMLVAARDLANDDSIAPDYSVADVTYLHLEFDLHTVIFAEGAASESYVDDGNRDMFDNAAGYRQAYPQEARRLPRYCAPRVEQGWWLEGARRQYALPTAFSR